jgi:arabinogalactan endo-1,4-beta-galactosidase
VGGGFLRVVCYEGMQRKYMAVLHLGSREGQQRCTAQNFLYADEGHNRGLQVWMRAHANREIAHYRLNDTPDQWQDVVLNSRELYDFARAGGETLAQSGIDRLMIAVGA